MCPWQNINKQYQKTTKKQPKTTKNNQKLRDLKVLATGNHILLNNASAIRDPHWESRRV
jgi:hypothetical protein